MLQRGLVALALGLGAVTAGAQSAAPASCPPAAQPLPIEQIQAGLGESRDRGFLWRLRRDGRESYLYGTVHVARAPWVLPGPALAQALAASDTVALELDMLDPDIQRRVAAGLRAGPDEQLPAALAVRLQAQWRAACVPPEALEAMAAMSPALQLAALTTLAARADGLEPAYAIDAVLAVYGRALGKTVRSLETPELQLALLKGDPQATQELLARGLEQLERGEARPVLLRAAEVWAGGREDELARYEQWCACADTAAERAQLKRLLDERNPALADGIEALHAAGQRVFAAVGALHMVGPAGLPALLAARGFVVERRAGPLTARRRPGAGFRGLGFHPLAARRAEGHNGPARHHPKVPSMVDPSSFAKLVPGFEFLQGLVQNAGSAVPGIGQWVAPTLNPEELDKRISELRAVQFWLEQNARMLGATIQALEVQRMTLSTLKTMNVQMTDLRDALLVPLPKQAAAPAVAQAPARPAPAWPAPVKAEPAPVPQRKPEPEPEPEPAAAAPAAAPKPGPGGVDPMQWWGALTKQFAELATAAMKDGPAAAQSLAGAVRKAVAEPAQAAPRKTAVPKKPARKAAKAAPRKRAASRA